MTSSVTPQRAPNRRTIHAANAAHAQYTKNRPTADNRESLGNVMQHVVPALVPKDKQHFVVRECDPPPYPTPQSVLWHPFPLT